jgi:hypothetical protein
MSTDPVTTIVALTEAIVNAAKPKKTRAPKAPATIPTIDVDEIIANFTAGKYAIEAAANLNRIFGREFEPIAEEIVNLANLLPTSPEVVVKEKKPRASKKAVTPAEAPAEAPAETSVEAPAKDEKAKKPRASKKAVTPAEAQAETSVEAPAKDEKAKKPRASKKTVVAEAQAEAIVVAETPVAEAAPAPVKAKKPRASKKTVVAEAPVAEAPVVAETPVAEAAPAPVKAKKPRASKKAADPDINELVAAVESLAVVEAPIVTEVVKEKKTKKTKKSETASNDGSSDEDSVAGVKEEKKTKKPRASKKAVNAETAVIPQTPLLVEEEVVLTLVQPSEFIDQELTDGDMEGFAAEWGQELVEEELSDIEDDE